MKLKWPAKVGKSWNNVMLVWLSDKLKSKKEMKGSFCYTFCFTSVEEVLVNLEIQKLSEFFICLHTVFIYKMNTT